jgi:NADH-quinone oxidoreductase subunit I
MNLPGRGLAKGLAVTLRTMTRRSVTRQYPDQLPDLPPRSRGVIALFEENCTVCMLCARECPDWCIYIDSHKETIPAKEPGARDRTRNMLDRFAIDFSLCMYCGICVEVCPFDALFWTPEFEYAEFDIRDLTHEKDRLRDWMWTVPPPPPVDRGAEPPKEIDAARKTMQKAAGGTAAGAAAGERPGRARGERPARAERPGRAERKPRAERPEPPERPVPTDVPGPGQPTQPPSEHLPPSTRQGAEADTETSPDERGPA